MRIEIYMAGKRLLADIIYPDGKKDSAIGEEVLNTKLDYIYTNSSKTLVDLVREGAVIIKGNVWNYYVLKDNKFFDRVDKDIKKTPVTKSKEDTKKGEPATKEKPVEKVESDGALDVSDAVVGSEERTKSSTTKVGKLKNRINLTKITKYGAGLLAIGGIAYMLAGGINNVVKNNIPNTPQNTPIVVNVEEDTIETTYNTSDEEMIVAYDFQEPQSYDYSNQGSAIIYDDIDTQIQIINDACISYQPCAFENLVVDSDRDAIATINNMRNRVLSGSCTAETYLNNIVNYIFEGGNIFDGKVIKNYDSLSPYAQYIVLVSSETILQNCQTYDHTTAANRYNFNILVNSYEYMIDAATRQLLGHSRTI